jgi:hypothetical protein
MENINLLLGHEDRNNIEIGLLSLLSSNCSEDAISFFLNEYFEDYCSCKIEGDFFIISKNEFKSDGVYMDSIEIKIKLKDVSDDFLYICGNYDWEQSDDIPYSFKRSEKLTKHGDDNWNETEWNNLIDVIN